jgi:hypothetical protein
MSAPARHFEGVLQRIPEERRDFAHAFLCRSFALVERMAEGAQAALLKESLTSATDVGCLARMLTYFAAEDAVRSADLLAEDTQVQTPLSTPARQEC